MRTLIKNGRLIDPSTNRDEKYDILILDAHIEKVLKEINEEADKIIDATDCYVMPGFVDMHVHLREPGFEYKETIKTGALAAARGGFTSICPMPNTNPVIDSEEMIEFIIDKAKKDSVVNIYPVGAVTLGQIGDRSTDVLAMKNAGAIAISEDGKSVMNSNVYKEAMEKAKEADILVLAHCEDRNLVGKGVLNAGKKAKALGLIGISNDVEDVIAARDILLAKSTGARLHLCHCSTKDSVYLIKEAKKNGLNVTGEVCPHHFTLSEEDIIDDDANYKMNPPLRTKEDISALIEGLKDGTIEVIATDHAPHHAEEKKKSISEAPFGIVGLETALALTMTELVEKDILTPMEMVKKLSYNPSKILGIDRGSLQEGKIADVVIVDPNRKYTINSDDFVSMGKNTPFNGKEVTGKVIATIVSGKIVYEE